MLPLDRKKEYLEMWTKDLGKEKTLVFITLHLKENLILK